MAGVCIRYKNCLLWAMLSCLFILVYINANSVVFVDSSSVKFTSEKLDNSSVKSTSEKSDSSSVNFTTEKLDNSSVKFTSEKLDNLSVNSTSEKLDSLDNCTSERIESYFQSRGRYMVLYNFVQASATFKCNETVTYTTNADYTFLGNVETLVDRWDGPLSIAVYAPGDDFVDALKSIAYLRQCRNEKIKKYVTFHIFFDAKHYPAKKNFTKSFKDGYNCDLPAPYLGNKSKSYRSKHKLLYPINVARNIARVTATTYYIFPSDIELYPVYNFPERFLRMIRETPQYQNWARRMVFVLPIFEITANSNVPNNKTELQKMLQNGTAQTFHAELCLSCHKIPQYEQWVTANETEQLHVFTSTNELGEFKHWEPFYVGTQREPLFDERLSWEGQSDKIVQSYTMCLLNYEYMVLDNAFLIHKPGIKKAKEKLPMHSKVVRKTKNLIQNVIELELKNLYGDRPGCIL